MKILVALINFLKKNHSFMNTTSNSEEWSHTALHTAHRDPQNTGLKNQSAVICWQENTRTENRNSTIKFGRDFHPDKDSIHCQNCIDLLHNTPKETHLLSVQRCCSARSGVPQSLNNSESKRNKRRGEGRQQFQPNDSDGMWRKCWGIDQYPLKKIPRPSKCQVLLYFSTKSTEKVQLQAALRQDLQHPHTDVFWRSEAGSSFRQALCKLCKAVTEGIKSIPVQGSGTARAYVTTDGSSAAERCHGSTEHF